MSRRTIVLSAAVAVLGAGLTATNAFGHAEVKNRTPKPGSSLSSAPKTIRISFDEAVVTGKFASVTRNGKAVAFASKLSTHKAAIIATPKSELQAGTYKVSWRALADDGHHEKGSWSFRVR